MAHTGITELDDIYFAELVQKEVLFALRPAMTTRNFLRFATPGPSNVASFGKYGDLGAASAPASDITDITDTAWSSTQVSATAAEVGIMVTVSDVLRKISATNVVADTTREITAAVLEKWETDVAALMDDFSNVTTAASTLTPADLLAAVSALEQRDVPGPYVAYLDPKQTGELRNEFASTTASYNINRGNEIVKPFENSGYFGNVYGVDIFQTSLVVTTSGLAGGAVFASKQALGAYELWGPRVESFRDISLRGLELVGTACYGLAEIDDTRGQTVKSSA